MALHRSLDENKIIAALLHDVSTSCGAVFNSRSLRLTLQKINRRLSSEGMSFLTKTLPRLGKAFDKALTEHSPLNATDLRLTAQKGSKLPKLFGELFNEVLKPDGTVLPEPSTNCVRFIRQLCYLYYKYELPYSDEQEQQVVQKFEKTEDDLSTVTGLLENLQQSVENTVLSRTRRNKTTGLVHTVREARILLARLFSSFDPKDIYPRHGPGAVATKQKLWDKYRWSNVSEKITSVYPLDEYFYSSLGHVCDSYQEFCSLGTSDLPARVILVPKDSRGPRLISCEPVDYQWVQQGLGRAIVELVERRVLTKYNVFFTDQVPNRIGALFGSSTGKYATLDLSEASDRVSLGLVRLLFPPHIYECLEACRSSSTELPDGRVLGLKKFAPMGSCLCFPIMALTIWSLLTAAAPDANTRQSIHVYGDDVIVPTGFARDAIEQLESFGLKINHDKSCTSGFFRESCGMDAFKGVDVTPVRFRTVWSSTRSPEVYASWIAYANSFFHRKCFTTYNLIVEELIRIYGPIPGKELHIGAPSLVETPLQQRPIKRRWDPNLQKFEYHVYVLKSPSIHHEMDGWSKLLRWFAEAANDRNRTSGMQYSQISSFEGIEAFRVSQYTRRSTSMLVKRWR